MNEPLERVTAQQIVEESAKLYGVKVEEVYSRKKTKYIVEARQYAMYRMFKDHKWTKLGISLFFFMNHATVIHAIRQIEWRVENNQLWIN